MTRNVGFIMKEIYLIDHYLSPDSYDDICVDMDNTLVMWWFGTHNKNLIDFLFLSKTRGKTVRLLTRAGNARMYLKRFQVPLELFDEINEHMTGPKSELCTPTSIFIDDQEKERSEVKKALGIPCIDPATPAFRLIADLPTGYSVNSFPINYSDPIASIWNMYYRFDRR